ncbi:organoarsenical effux MFS transporter ArsJ [Pseudocolwellia sp. HL-MZ19]|uniref:organoarsenical effux MFS transporter ArsJ n=1 Tax=unclassified Pseudocolwellia TaxID=2848178 RepID=UPI003CF6BAB2
MTTFSLKTLPEATKQYCLITSNYWAFTLTDGALRMLVVLHFYALGYSPLNIAMLFLFYEIFGVITNLVGGWLGAKIGLNRTMNIGLVLQIAALVMLTVPEQYLLVWWVMLAQALSGIAKDLNKMSAKSSIKMLVPEEEKAGLFKWVALLTGSKNALKGVGFFLGAFLLSTVGFKSAMLIMAIMLFIVVVCSIRLLKQDLGKTSYKPKFKQLFSNSSSLNYLALARMTLFASRDIWFVVALPVFLAESLDWEHDFIGTFMACWVILYGIIQTLAPKITGKSKGTLPSSGMLSFWAFLLVGVILSIVSLGYLLSLTSMVIVIGLLAFAAVFAVNSSLHSYVIIALANSDGVSMDVGFYYMANAMGRLLGTVLSGVVFQLYGIESCLLVSALLVLISGIFIRKVAI